METITKKQDMPPPGGYQKIPFARVPAKSYFSGMYFDIVWWFSLALIISICFI